MTSLIRQFFDTSRFGQPYDGPGEHLTDMVRWCQLSLAAFLPCFAPHIKWEGAVEPDSDADSLRRGVLTDRDKALFLVDSRARSSEERGDFLAVEYVRRAFRLTDLELFAMTALLLPSYDERFGRLFAALQEDRTRQRPGLDLILKLYHFAGRAEDIEGFHEERHALRKKAELALLGPDRGLDPRLEEFLFQNGGVRLEAPAVRTWAPGPEPKPLLIREETARALAGVISADGAERETLYICLKAAPGTGRNTQVRRVAEILGLPVVFFDCGACRTMRRGEFFARLRTAGRETILEAGILALRRFEALLEEPETAKEALDTAGLFSGAVFVLAADGAVTVEAAAGRRWVESRIPPPDKEESIALWERELKTMPLSEPVEAFEMANKFAFTPAQIVGTARTAAGAALLKGPLDARGVTEAAYGQISHRLGEYATLIYARHSWEQLVLGDHEKETLKSACDRVRFRHIVYDRWGFDRRLAYGKGVSMMFAGPPGTGKTMAAQVVANDLGIEMYKVDLSKVVSKYIGETEKNLDQVFTEAKKSNVILFFDETDAILGKRTEVKDSHDKNANLETAYLLQKMEEYDGITVMTTNYRENIDSAFFRRISYIINFPFPDEKARRAIWAGIFPEETPLDRDVDLDYLARQFEISGGSIKNIALAAAFMAAGEGGTVGMRQIVRAVRYEMAKQGKIMLKEEYGEYGYLLR